MSPLSIPGTNIQIPYPPGKAKCKGCGRDYDRPKVKREGNFVRLHCPSCKIIVKTLSYRALLAKSKK
jgi:hypothetical protein